MSAEKDSFARFLKHFTKGTALFAEGDEGEEMYIIRSGRVARNMEEDLGRLDGKIAFVSGAGTCGAGASVGSPAYVSSIAASGASSSAKAR